jgi:hypothetical protein
MLFRTVVTLAHKWAINAAASKAPGFSKHIAFELLSRLRQLDWIYAEIQQLETAYWSTYRQKHGDVKLDTSYVVFFIASAIPDELSTEFSAEDQLRLQVESFYYVAHRLVVILDQCKDSLPGLASISAEPVRRIRNNLIEHANKQGGREAYSFSISNAAGLRLRSAAPAGDPDTFVDEGIHKNAQDLSDELGSIIRSAIKV